MEQALKERVRKQAESLADVKKLRRKNHPSNLGKVWVSAAKQVTERAEAGAGCPAEKCGV
jgi:hypothetical protein